MLDRKAELENIDFRKEVSESRLRVSPNVHSNTTFEGKDFCQKYA